MFPTTIVNFVGSKVIGHIYVGIMIAFNLRSNDKQVLKKPISNTDLTQQNGELIWISTNLSTYKLSLKQNGLKK